MHSKKEPSPSIIELSQCSPELSMEQPYCEEGVSAGFPSPAEDFGSNSLDLNKELIKHPSSTFFCRVNGNSMQDVGINNGDILIIDKSLSPQNKKIAVCFIDGEFTLKTIEIKENSCQLIPANKEYSTITVDEKNEFIIWGIVTYVIKSF